MRNGVEFLAYLIRYTPLAAGLLFPFWLGRELLRARARRRGGSETSPLSRDELRKARSKLKKAKT